MRLLHLEVIYQGDHCPASYYMEEAVEEVLPLFEDRIHYTRVEYKKDKEQARRFYDLSVSLFGEEALRRLQCAPIPSLFIDGILVFDVIPQRDELIAAIRSFLEDQ